MPEELALTQEVKHPPAIQELDRTSADDSHVLHRRFLLAEDRRAGGEELHLSRLRKFLQLRLGEVVERSVPSQELDYVVHRRCVEVCLIRLVGRQSGRSHAVSTPAPATVEFEHRRPDLHPIRHARPRGGDRADLQAGDRGAGCDVPDSAPASSRDRSGYLCRKARHDRGGKRPRSRLGERGPL
jgi:hypothetical protein